MKKTLTDKKTKTSPAPKRSSKKIKFYPPMVIDNEPIRKVHIHSVKKISRELDRARADWSVYEKEDRPAFRKWLNSTFGRELTIIREMKDRVHELEHLLNEIENCKYMNRITYFQAYILVMDMRENPEKYKDKDSGEDTCHDDHDDRKSSDSGSGHRPDEYETTEEDLRTLFIQFMHETNPVLLKTISKDKRLFDKAFSIFKEEYYADQPADSNHGQKDAKNNPETGTRLRTLYRDLARRLHPDSRKETNIQYDEIWHEVQTAYRENNLERMEMLSALCNIQTGDFYETASISQLIQIQQEYKAQLKALRDQAKRVKDDPAWGFSKKESTVTIKRYIRNDLNEGIEILKYKLEEMEYILKRWSKPPQNKKPAPSAEQAPGKKTPSKKIPKPAAEDNDIQMEIPF
jgi:hypothetical protein